MKPIQIAVAGVVSSGLLAGIADGLLGDAVGVTKLVADFGPTLVGLGFIFAWLHYDERRYAYRRSALLNIGIAALAILFVPVYLVRSRAAGHRLFPVLGFFGVVALWVIIGLITTEVVQYVAT